MAEGPSVMGWLRPVILVPAGWLMSLPAEQAETVLLHELAHIRRHDYLVNLIQSAVEDVLFYHPAVWWVGRVMRRERENCCDDAAVAMGGDRRTYAGRWLRWRACGRASRRWRLRGDRWRSAFGGCCVPRRGLVLRRLRWW